MKSRDVSLNKDDGFTLIEILIAIVLVGILSAVAVVGISNLVSKGSSSGCQASSDAAKAGSAVYFASNSRYPANLNELTAVGTTGAPMTLPAGVTVNSVASVAPASPTGVAAGLQTVGGTWWMTMTAGVSGAAPTFSCA